jgi:tRNA nucleotidyltransferase (CCA-adding enzyme)
MNNLKPTEKYRKAVFVVIYKKENNKTLYLILKRYKHWKGWEFAKGGIYDGETELETAKRELKEECGLKLKSIKNPNIKGKYKYPHQFPDRDGIMGQTYSLYSAEVYPGEVKIDKNEHSDYKWLEYKDALKTLSKQNQKVCLGIVSKYQLSISNPK